MNDLYPVQWVKYYERDLLALWDLLGVDLRERTTPVEFRNWVYEYSLHGGVNPDMEIPGGESDSRTYTDNGILTSLVEENYVRMYHYCEQSYLPLLHYHNGALDSLLDLCFLYEDDMVDE